VASSDLTMEDRPRELPYPAGRRLTFDVGRLGHARHRVHALLEVDVTDARARIRARRRGGERWSFAAWVIKTVADAVAAHPEVAGFNRPRRNRVVVFRDVDVALVVERAVAGTHVPLPLVIRRADAKTVLEIGAEIEAAKTQAVADEGDLVLGQRREPWPLRAFLRLPQAARLTLMRIGLGSPRRTMSAMGNVMVTTVGMAGRARGWIVPSSVHPVCVALGSLGEKPALHDGQIVARTILNVTVLIDHDVVDGIPAARFVADAVRRWESAAGS
jgi:pyruvate/2-oxoglutarate dehydrogenase complex dihydrolipoamide acyltransferase (E2) component